MFLQHEGFLGAVGALLNYKKIDLNILVPHKLTACDSSRLSDVGEEFHGKLEERVSNSSYHFLLYEVHEPVLHLSLILNLDEMLIVNYSVAGLDLYNYVLSLCLSLHTRTHVHVLCLPIYCVCCVFLSITLHAMSLGICEWEHENHHIHGWTHFALEV